MNSESARYLVTIGYREPSYGLVTRGRVRAVHVHRARFEVVAHDGQRAILLARQAFERFTAASSVGWVREVVDLECRALGEHERCVTMLGAEPEPEAHR